MAIFEQQLDELIQNRKNMGIEEAILAEAKQDGLEEGIAIGMEKGIEKGVLLQKKQIILNGASQGLSLALLSTLTELTEQEVKDILNNNQ